MDFVRVGDSSWMLSRCQMYGASPPIGTLPCVWSRRHPPIVILLCVWGLSSSLSLDTTYKISILKFNI